MSQLAGGPAPSCSEPAGDGWQYLKAVVKRAQHFTELVALRYGSQPGHPELGVARGLLQERPLQFQYRNARVKSWQPMSNSWSTSSQPDFVRALGRRKPARNLWGKILYTELLSKVDQLLVRSSPTLRPMVSCRGLPCNIVLWQHIRTPKTQIRKRQETRKSRVQEVSRDF